MKHIPRKKKRPGQTCRSCSRRLEGALDLRDVAYEFKESQLGQSGILAAALPVHVDVKADEQAVLMAVLAYHLDCLSEHARAVRVRRLDIDDAAAVRCGQAVVVGLVHDHVGLLAQLSDAYDALGAEGGIDARALHVQKQAACLLEAERLGRVAQKELQTSCCFFNFAFQKKKESRSSFLKCILCY